MKSSVIRKVLELHPYVQVPEKLKDDLELFDDIYYVNGCGTINGFFADIAPSSIDGICILAACIVHDVRYYTGSCIEDKNAADVEFLVNLNLILAHAEDTNSLDIVRRQLRFEKALTFFRFVHEYGLKAFVASKNVSVREITFIESLTQSAMLTFRALLIPVQIITEAVLVKLKLYDRRRYCPVNVSTQE